MDISRNVHQAAIDIEHILPGGKQLASPVAVYEIADAPKHGLRDFLHYFGKWENGKILFGTAYSWFALDVSFLFLLYSRCDARTRSHITASA